MESSILRQYQEYSRYLRPFRSVTFTDREMLTTMLQYVEPDDVASITQLLGDRRGVIRITFKTNIGVQRLEESVKQQRLVIKGVQLGMVEESGHYFILTLDNVPNFISEEQVEDVMSQFGVIAGVLRDHLEYHGKKIETEKRRVLYTKYHNPTSMPKDLEICGIQVFVKGQSSQGGREDGVGGGAAVGGLNRGSHARPSLESLLCRDAATPSSSVPGTPLRDGKDVKASSGGRKTAAENGEQKVKKGTRSNALNSLNNQLRGQ